MGAASQFMFLVVCHFIWCAIASTPFYPFGQGTGDLLVPSNDDGSSGKVSLSTPFPFFDSDHDSLFVNTNGVISFLVQVSQYTPYVFPLGDNRRLLAPYWADVDTRVAGKVWYRESTDPVLLQKATDAVISVYVDHRKFQATWLFIATWDSVGFYGSSTAYMSKTNTFQVVLITNGRHSFAIYYYEKLTWTTGTSSSGNASGLGGFQAQAGFNAGDGIRFFNLPGSRTHQVLLLTSKSNIGRPGQWMFQIDNARIEAGGCNTKGSLVTSPRTAHMLGGENLFISGPCFTQADEIVCEFPSGKTTNGTYISAIRASCTVPMLNVTGRFQIKMSVNGGKVFDFRGILTIVNINRERPHVTRLMPESWTEERPVSVTWQPQFLGSERQTVSVQLARFSMEDDRVSFHSLFILISEQLNTGTSNFSVPKGEGDGNSVHRFVTLVSVQKAGRHRTQTSAEWIWSDVFSWINHAKADERCLSWHRNQPSPTIFTSDPSLLPCPQTFVQAMADRGRYMFDEFCNPRAEDYCAVYHFGATHCFRTNTPSNQGAAQQCCYNIHGNLMGPPNGGSLDRFHTDTGIPVLSHFFQDLVSYLDCCFLSENCAKYFEKRTSDDGTRYEPPRPATGFGDPHMITLDGVEYSFNGYGEYRILQVADANFTLQGRMQRLISDIGVQSRATVYKAFAMMENGSDVVQIHINGRDEIDALVNGHVINFDEQPLAEFSGGVLVKSVGTSKYVAIFNSGISVGVEKAEDILQLMLFVPTIFKGNTSGLLGFWDDDKEKEFLLPNGTFLETTSNLSTIHHEFGQRWATSSSDSLFTYEQGKDHSSHFDAGFVPLFLDQSSLVFRDLTLGRLAKETCGNNTQCLFDIHTTGKVSIGNASKQAVEQFVEIVNEIETPGCTPMDSSLQGGTTRRNDTADGRVTYTFRCNSGYQLIGHAVISCSLGQWNGSKPKCIVQEISSCCEWYVYVASALAGVVLVAIVIIVVCCLRKRGRTDATSTVQMETTLKGSNVASVSAYTNPCGVNVKSDA